MMRQRASFPALIGMLAAFAALLMAPVAKAESWAAHVPKAALVGEHTFSKYIWDVYHISLLTPDASWSQNGPMALQLRYLLSIKGNDIAERSAQEMRHIGMQDEVRLAAWYSQMRDIFPDVTDGTVLTGVRTADGKTIFYEGEREIGQIQDPEFGRYFFGIWLDKNTSEPALRRHLLGKYAN